MNHLEQKPDELQNRIHDYVIRILRMHAAIPKRPGEQGVAARVLKLATGVATQYRLALRAKSDDLTAAKLLYTAEMLEEAGYWLTMLADTEMIAPRRLVNLRAECDDLRDQISALAQEFDPHEPD